MSQTTPAPRLLIQRTINLAKADLATPLGLIPFAFCHVCQEQVPVNYDELADGWRVWCPQCPYVFESKKAYWMDRPGWESAGWNLGTCDNQRPPQSPARC